MGDLLVSKVGPKRDDGTTIPDPHAGLYRQWIFSPGKKGPLRVLNACNWCHNIACAGWTGHLGSRKRTSPESTGCPTILNFRFFVFEIVDIGTYYETGAKIRQDRLIVRSEQMTMRVFRYGLRKIGPIARSLFRRRVVPIPPGCGDNGQFVTID